MHAIEANTGVVSYLICIHETLSAMNLVIPRRKRAHWQKVWNAGKFIRARPFKASLIRYALTNSHEEAPKNFGSPWSSCCVRHYVRGVAHSLPPSSLEITDRPGRDKLQCIGV
ncbi:hypothetical protein WN48_03513 [Eufriesea mexicana]|uniref:Uncharacterized protein n=1 Tax=Eufriesea mexicana TaxID=516756 RepID=A0A310SB03_9HYME|nr:hypothetical protein WN48_03513 [Eufriesea mexicana]